MTTNWNDTAFETRAIHAGQDPDPATGAIITPIYQTSTFVQKAVGEHQGYDYARTANPTRQALQEALASREGGAWGLAYASGMAARRDLDQRQVTPVFLADLGFGSAQADARDRE